MMMLWLEEKKDALDGGAGKDNVDTSRELRTDSGNLARDDYTSEGQSLQSTGANLSIEVLGGNKQTNKGRTKSMEIEDSEDESDRPISLRSRDVSGCVLFQNKILTELQKRRKRLKRDRHYRIWVTNVSIGATSCILEQHLIMQQLPSGKTRTTTPPTRTEKRHLTAPNVRHCTAGDEHKLRSWLTKDMDESRRRRVLRLKLCNAQVLPQRVSNVNVLQQTTVVSVAITNPREVRTLTRAASALSIKISLVANTGGLYA